MRPRSAFYREIEPNRMLSGADGFFDPVAMSTTAPDPDWELITTTLQGPEASVMKLAIQNGAVLHERAHWLQHIGTTAGFFSALISDTQSASISEFCRSKGATLGAEHLPLVDQEEATSDTWLATWLLLEWLHICAFGGIAVSEMQPFSLFQALSICSQSSKARHLELISDPKLREIVDRMWSSDVEFASQAKILKTQPADEATVFGAFHLMEGAARMNEFFYINSVLRTLNPNYAFDRRTFFVGRYAPALDTFYEILELQPGDRADVAFCVLADWALNTVLPPLYPPVFWGKGWHEFSPGMRFMQLTEGIKSLNLRSNLDLSNMQAVRSFVNDVYAAIPHNSFFAPPNVSPHSNFMEHAFPDLQPGRAVDAILARFGRGKDETKKRPMHQERLPWYYLVNRVKTAFDIRVVDPTILIVPGLAVKNEQNFFDSYNKIAAPFVFAGENAGSGDKEGDPQITALLMLEVMRASLSKWMVYLDVKEVARRVYRLGALHKGREEYCRAGIATLLRECRLRDELFREIKELAKLPDA